MKIGLIMEGGAMRGMFTAGVIDVLMEAGVSFDGPSASPLVPSLAVIINHGRSGG